MISGHSAYEVNLESVFEPPLRGRDVIVRPDTNEIRSNRPERAPNRTSVTMDTRGDVAGSRVVSFLEISEHLYYWRVFLGLPRRSIDITV